MKRGPSTNGGWSWRPRRGFDPVVVGVHGKKPTIDLKGTVEPTVAEDNIAIVTVHDGLALDPGEIIAPAVGCEPADPNYHNNYQDIEAFLRAAAGAACSTSPSPTARILSTAGLPPSS